jgi:predicted RNA-binding Zn-ribbon protein involved in translation (DUF1610 family)
VKGWIRVFTADNPVEVGFVRGLLEAEGIETRARSMELWAAAVEIYFAEGARPSVWVREHERERAETVIRERDRSGESKSRWTCPNCGERLDGQFTACWRCAEPGDGVDD